MNVAYPTLSLPTPIPGDSVLVDSVFMNDDGTIGLGIHFYGPNAAVNACKLIAFHADLMAKHAAAAALALETRVTKKDLDTFAMDLVTRAKQMQCEPVEPVKQMQCEPECSPCHVEISPLSNVTKRRKCM
jgi:hypothetical protein